MDRNQHTSLNYFNLSLQCRDSDFFKHGYKVRAFMKTFELVRIVWTYFLAGKKLFHPRRILMRVPLKSVSEVQFQAIWTCYMQSLFILFTWKTWHNWNKLLGSETLFKWTSPTLFFLSTANEAQLLDLSCKEDLKGKFS